MVVFVIRYGDVADHPIVCIADTSLARFEH